MTDGLGGVLGVGVGGVGGGVSAAVTAGVGAVGLVVATGGAVGFGLARKVLYAQNPPPPRAPRAPRMSPSRMQLARAEGFFRSGEAGTGGGVAGLMWAKWVRVGEKEGPPTDARKRIGAAAAILRDVDGYWPA
jgi:hypothetical protein